MERAKNTTCVRICPNEMKFTCADCVRMPDASLNRDEIGINRHRALGYCLSMLFSENRLALFRIML
jgi:hypothetical protein